MEVKILTPVGEEERLRKKEYEESSSNSPLIRYFLLNTSMKNRGTKYSLPLKGAVILSKEGKIFILSFEEGLMPLLIVRSVKT
jgi:hypothetical protein